MAGDGQVSYGDKILKLSAKKIRRLHDGRIIAGFAGSTADALTLFEKFEAKLKDYGGNLTRSAVELAKDWRTDRVLRRLDALLIVADAKKMFLLSGGGDVIEPDGDAMAIGTGGPVALAAARALLENTDLPAAGVAEKAMRLAAELDVFTNANLTIEEIAPEKP